MDNKFQRPNKAALTNAQYFSFMTAFGEQLQLAAFAETAIQTRQTALAAQVALVDKYLKIQQGSYLSQEIYDMDHRGDLAYGAAHAVTLAWLNKEFQPQAEAAEMVNRVFRLYKINTAAQYDEQWGLVGNFLTDIEKPELASYIQTLGIGQPLQVLRECYTQMKALIRQRDDELNGKVKGALVQTRKDCDRAYNAVLDIIEAAALMADDPTAYYEFITRWNTALTRYIQQIIGKKGGGSNQNNQSGQNNQNNSENSENNGGEGTNTNPTNPTNGDDDEIPGSGGGENTGGGENGGGTNNGDDDEIPSSGGGENTGGGGVLVDDPDAD